MYGSRNLLFDPNVAAWMDGVDEKALEERVMGGPLVVGREAVVSLVYTIKRVNQSYSSVPAGRGTLVSGAALGVMLFSCSSSNFKKCSQLSVGEVLSHLPQSRGCEAARLQGQRQDLTSKFHCASNFTTTSIPRPTNNIANMASKNLPPSFNATSNDIEMLLASQAHLGAKNLQVHMEPVSTLHSSCEHGHGEANRAVVPVEDEA